MEYYPDSILTVRLERTRSFSFLFNHQGTLAPSLVLDRGLLDQAAANKGGGTDMMRTVQKLLVAFLLGAISCSLAPGMAKAQVRERVKVGQKRKPAPKKKDKDKDDNIKKGKAKRNSPEEPLGNRELHPTLKNHDHEKPHADGSLPNTNAPPDPCEEQRKYGDEAYLWCKEALKDRQKSSVPKGQSGRPPGQGR